MNSAATILVVDDHDRVRRSMRALLESAGFSVLEFASAENVLGFADIGQAGCLISDISMPQMNGLELQAELAKRGERIPIIFVTGHADVPLAVQAIRAGAADFLEKPFDDEVLLESVRRALIVSRAGRNQTVEAQKAIAILEQLSERERVVLGRLVQGESNKQVGHALGISPRTVEVHRARILEKTKAQGLAGLVRIARAAEGLSRATT